MSIKRIHWAGVAFLAMNAVCNFVHADETPQPPFRLDGLYTYVGFQAGVNWATLSGNGSYFLGSHTGFQAGAQADIPYSYWFSLMPTVRFAQRGFSFINSNASGTLNYLEVPVLAKFNVPTTYGFTPFVFVGPNFGFKTGTGGDAMLEGSVHFFDFGLDTGVGAQFQLNQTTRFFADFEYYVGLTDVTADSNLTNSVPEINIGFEWAL